MKTSHNPSDIARRDEARGTCVCGCSYDRHICTDPGCPRVGMHAESCADCGPDCPDYLCVFGGSAKLPDIATDTVRHNSVDMDTREIELSDIEAAYKDATGRRLQFSATPVRYGRRR